MGATVVSDSKVSDWEARKAWYPTLFVFTDGAPATETVGSAGSAVAGEVCTEDTVVTGKKGLGLGAMKTGAVGAVGATCATGTTMAGGTVVAGVASKLAVGAARKLDAAAGAARKLGASAGASARKLDASNVPQSSRERRSTVVTWEGKRTALLLLWLLP
jgi:hypothetical protein